MNQSRKWKKIFFLCAVCTFCLFSSGCIYVIAGGIGVVGGYAISPDAVEGESATSYDAAWDSATEILGIMGNINSKDYKLGTIIATVDGSTVTMDVSQVSSDEIRLRVKARKNMLPNIKLAQDIFVKVKKRINE
ncbi:MAG: hypothetical protein P9M12_00975 [Candidatus Aceula lacicola]|nr:hypothetical protein [Candidatus Aceula lacicola]